MKEVKEKNEDMVECHYKGAVIFVPAKLCEHDHEDEV